MRTRAMFGLGMWVAAALVLLAPAGQAQGPSPQGGGGLQAALGTAFTYQGLLKKDGAPVTDSCDFQFSLWDAEGDGNPVGTPQTRTNVEVRDGLFTVPLDFGAGAFTGEARWLAIAVRCPAGSGGYTALVPRQRLTPAPYALALPGLRTEETAGTPNVIGGSSANTAGGAVGVTIGGGGSSAHPNLVASAPDSPYAAIGGGEGNSIFGSHSTIGGGLDNTVVYAPYATIAGGRENWAEGRCATVGGGCFNYAYNVGATVSGGISNTAEFSATVGGGEDNWASGRWATIGGGQTNRASGTYATLAGGRYNRANASYATVGGGTSNRVLDHYGTVAGGGGNWAGSDDSDPANAQYATVGGGQGNQATAAYATVGGGKENQATGNYATVGGGWLNTALSWATIGGGMDNDAGPDATVGGGRWNVAGSQATVGGGVYNQATAAYATVPGGYQAHASHYGELAYASGQFAQAGDAQTSLYVMRLEGTFPSGGGYYNLFLDGSGQFLTVATGRALAFEALVVGRSDAGESAGYLIRGVIENPGSEGFINFVGTPTVTVLGEDDSAWDARASIDATRGALVIQVHGNGETIRWVASVRTAEVAW